MVVRRSHFVAVLMSLALVPGMMAGQKIEFSDPATTWAVPEQEKPDTKTDSQPISLNFLRPIPTADPSEMMALQGPTVFLRPATKSAKDRYDSEDPYATADSSDSRQTNSLAMPRAWDSDTDAFAFGHDGKERNPFESPLHRDALNPFNSRSQDSQYNIDKSGSLDNASSGWDANSFWKNSLHGPSDLHDGDFNSDGLPMRRTETSKSGISTYSQSAMAESDATAMHPFPSAFDRDESMTLTAPTLKTPWEDNANASHRQVSHPAPTQLFWGPGRREPPPAVLPFPHRPGSVFQ